MTFAAAVTLALASCSKSPTEPAVDQNTDSRSTADVVAAAVGTPTGGSGMVFNDAMTLVHGGVINDAVVKGGQIQSTDTVHTATVTRTKSWGPYSYTGTWTHTWEFFDAAGNPMLRFVKGQTDKIVISTKGQHTASNGRVSTSDSSNGNWTITGIVANPDAPILNGTLNRAGEVTRTATGAQMTHTFTINWANDTLLRTDDGDGDGMVTYLKGPATSDFKAVNFHGNSFERQVQITFNGDGTATLNVTRTSGDGKVDTFTIDVKRGVWLRDNHLN